jgi:nitrite reductase/ring-hydroxylating ferredoxin subunit
MTFKKLGVWRLARPVQESEKERNLIVCDIHKKEFHMVQGHCDLRDGWLIC